MKNLIKNESCYLCGGRQFIKRAGSVRDNSDLDVLVCNNCSLVFLSSFSHISKDFYINSGMHEEKINLEEWIKETSIDDERRLSFLKKHIENKSIFDFGCGNGNFLLKAKKYAKYVAGIELESAFMSYFKENELNVAGNIAQINKKFDFITMFHVLEHLTDPIQELINIKGFLNKNGQVIIEVPNSEDALIKLYDCEAFENFTYWSCHLFSFNTSTLMKIAEKAGMKVNYIKQIQRYPLANHMYWLKEGKPGGHKLLSFLDSEKLNVEYASVLEALGCCDTLLASLSFNN